MKAKLVHNIKHIRVLLKYILGFFIREKSGSFKWFCCFELLHQTLNRHNIPTQ